MDQSSSAPASQLSRSGRVSPAKNVVETALEAGNLTTFAAGVRTAGLTKVLSTKGPFTVFAPTDEAFGRLPSGAWDALLKDLARLKAVLGYHVIEGRILAGDLKSGEMMTLQGNTLMAAAAPAEKHVNGARITLSDQAATNGIVHSIDAVILPRNWQLLTVAA